MSKIRDYILGTPISRLKGVTQIVAPRKRVTEAAVPILSARQKVTARTGATESADGQSMGQYIRAGGGVDYDDRPMPRLPARSFLDQVLGIFRPAPPPPPIPANLVAAGDLEDFLETESHKRGFHWRPSGATIMSWTDARSQFFFTTKVYLWPPEHEYTVALRKDDLLKLLESKRPFCPAWPEAEPAKT